MITDLLDKKPELAAYVDAECTELERFWQNRNTQFAIDRTYINLIHRRADTTKIKYITYNDPKIVFDTCVSIMSSTFPRFRIPVTETDFSHGEKNKMNKAERFILGVFRYLDYINMRRGRNYWFREMTYWLLTGMCPVFTAIDKVNGETVFIGDIYDPMTVFPKWDEDDLAKCVRSYMLPYRNAVSLANRFGKDFTLSEDDQKTESKVINYWEKEGNTVVNTILLRDVVLKNRIESFKHIPIMIGVVGVPDVLSPSWDFRYCESIIAANREMFDLQDDIATLRKQIIRETAYPNLITYTETGEPAVKAEQLKGDSSVIPLQLTDKLELLKHAATPADVDNLLREIDAHIQRGGLPNVSFGILPYETSGFALSQLLSAIKYKLVPYARVMENMLSRMGTGYVEQFRSGSYGTVKLSTTNADAVRHGQFFVEDFSKKDVPEVTFVEVTVPMNMPIDKNQQILQARQALQKPALMSRETLWDEYLDIQDASQEYDRIIDDEIADMPDIKIMTIIARLEKRLTLEQKAGNMDNVNLLKEWLNTIRQRFALLPQPKQTQSGGVTAPPEFVPPEAGITAPSPDMTNAMSGIPPPIPTATGGA